jgi:hypothetical protein
MHAAVVKARVANGGSKGPQPQTAQDSEPGSVKKTWKASHRNPADRATLQATPHDSLERANPCRLSPAGEQVSTGCLHGEGCFKQPRPQGQPGDRLTCRQRVHRRERCGAAQSSRPPQGRVTHGHRPHGASATGPCSNCTSGYSGHGNAVPGRQSVHGNGSCGHHGPQGCSQSEGSPRTRRETTRLVLMG